MATRGNSPVVTINGCAITGAHQPASADLPRALDVFYGIPFARARRFRPAERLDPGHGIPDQEERVDASRPGSVQPVGFGSLSEMAENPLRLDIFRPASDSDREEEEEEGEEEEHQREGAEDEEERQETQEEREAGGQQDVLVPVVMFVHGGAFNFGDAMERDLASFVSWAGRGIVAVSAAYRLGALGFPLREDGDEADFEDEEDEQHAAGQTTSMARAAGGGAGGAGEGKAMNLGLRDQRIALEWVRTWISAFGGDPDAITMMGCSAGAHSIGHHMLSPSPLGFRKAILESGSPTARAVLSPSHPRTVSQWRSFKHHVQNHRRRLLLQGQQQQQQPPPRQPGTRIHPPAVSLARAPLDAILEASAAVYTEHSPSVTWPFQPVVDAAIIPDLPLNLWHSHRRPPRNQNQNTIPTPTSSSPRTSRPENAALPKAIITGFCSHEGTLMAPQHASTSSSFTSFFQSLIPALSPADIAALEALYPDPLTHPASPYTQDPSPPSPTGDPYGAQFRRIHEAFAHYAYIAPVLHTAHAASRAGARVYLYEYAARAAPFGLASHGDQAPAVAHVMPALRDKPGLLAVADAMNARWTDFIAADDDADATGFFASDDDDATTGPTHAWPQFRSPFDDQGNLLDGPPQGRLGQLLVFGEGNDEAAGGNETGTAVRTRRLTERELRQCKFWWQRMELSQGLCEPGNAKSPF